jgi:hypothetical protein
LATLVWDKCKKNVKMGKWEDGKMGKCVNGKIGKCEDGKMGKIENALILFQKPQLDLRSEHQL